MINREFRNQVGKLWTEFWTGGITNPLMVIEQISFLMFARLLDIRETREEKKPNGRERTSTGFSRRANRTSGGPNSEMSRRRLKCFDWLETRCFPISRRSC